MGIGIGIVLVVVGLVLLTGAVDLPASITDNVQVETLGWITLLVGALALVLAVVAMSRGSRTTIEERHVTQ